MFRAYGSYVLDHTGPLMVMVIKLTSFAYDLDDDAKLEKQKSVKTIEHVAKVDFIDFLSFLLFFPGLLAGPAMTYHEYQNFMNMKMFEGVNMFEDNILKERTKKTRTKILYGYCFMLVYLIGRKFLKLPFFYDSYFLSLPFLVKILILHINAFIERCKYYFVWTIAEASLISIGIGFHGVNAEGHSTWYLLFYSKGSNAKYQTMDD